jgi:hypothetical protein
MVPCSCKRYNNTGRMGVARNGPRHGGDAMRVRFVLARVGCIALLGLVAAGSVGVPPAMGHAAVIGNSFFAFGILPSIVPLISTGQVVVVTSRTFTSQVGGVPSTFHVTSIALTPGQVPLTAPLGPFPNPMLGPLGNPLATTTLGPLGNPFVTPIGGTVGVVDPPAAQTGGATGVIDPPGARTGAATNPRSGAAMNPAGPTSCVMSSCRLEQALTNRRLSRERNLPTVSSEAP